MCECPEGYEGLSCERCAWGYAKVATNSTNLRDNHLCVKCDCNGHVGSCDLLMGECGVSFHLFISEYKISESISSVGNA